MTLSTRSEETTRGIRVTVQSRYLEDQSRPYAERFVFAYTVRIENLGDEPAQLRTRHWIILDGLGEREDVKGPGVVGETPRLQPGEGFQYTSGAILKTQRGSMRGTYQMFTDDGEQFDAVVGEFLLERPFSLN